MARDRSVVRILYRLLLDLYPKAFRDQLGESMAQTFNDLLREHRKAGREVVSIVLRTFVDTAGGIVNEHVSHHIMKNIATNPGWAALVGFLFVVPFLTLNTIVGAQIEPFYSLLRPAGSHPGLLEFLLLFILLLLLPLVGAFIAARPMFGKKPEGEKRFYLLNFIVAVVLLTGSIGLSIGLGREVYRCDVLKIPNCD